MIRPAAAVRVLDREVGPLRREHRVLHHDDAADQIHPLRVDLLRDRARLVVRLRGADAPRQGHCRGDEADLTVLVLDVELDRVQPRQREVLVELAGDRGERHRDVHAANRLRRRQRLDDLRRSLGDDLLDALRRLRRLGAAVASDLRGVGDPAGHQDEHADRSHPARAPDAGAASGGARDSEPRDQRAGGPRDRAVCPLSGRSRYRPKCPCKHGKPERAGSAP